MNETNSITTAINNWLLQYEQIKEVAKISTEELADEYEALALQRTGVENLSNKYITEKGWRRQYQYMLLLKSESEDDKQRLKNLDWLDDLSDWIVQQKKLRNFPKLKNKKVTDVSCSNALTYQVEDDGSISAYYLQLYFDIKGGN